MAWFAACLAASTPAYAATVPTPEDVASAACQAMFYVKDKRFQRVIRVSTGTPGHETPFGYYTLSNTLRGWYCSTLYPESCGTHSVGEFSYISDYGNMYNPRQVIGDIFLHGSTSVPTYPASHGCIRVRVSDSDCLYHNVDRMPFFITGNYTTTPATTGDLVVDGQLGPKTYGALQEWLGRPVDGSLSVTDNKALQTKL